MIMVCVWAVIFAEIMVELIKPFLRKSAPVIALDVDRLFKSLHFTEHVNNPVAKFVLADTRKLVWTVRIDTLCSLHICLVSILHISAPLCPFWPLGWAPQGAFWLFFAPCLAYLPLWVCSVGHGLPVFLLWLIWPGNWLSAHVNKTQIQRNICPTWGQPYGQSRVLFLLLSIFINHHHISLNCKTLRRTYSVFAGTFTGCKTLCARDVHLIFWNTHYLFVQVPTVTFSFSSWYLLGIIRKISQSKKRLWCWCSVTLFEQGVGEVSTPCCASGEHLHQELAARMMLPYI